MWRVAQDAKWDRATLRSMTANVNAIIVRYLVGCPYNFCFVHHELSKITHVGFACTPSMAAGLTDHVWSIRELLTYKPVPPAWVDPVPPKPPRRRPVSDPVPSRRTRVLFRKGVLCSLTG
jgi:hypothetical protein